jgi:GT2 family glycosyltransferase
MLEMLQLPQVGVVGAKLLYPDNTVQHAGVVLWHCGTAGYLHSKLPRDEHGYFGMADTIRDCSAVSAACMLVKKTLFDRLNGFDKSFRVSYQDVDFCLRAGEAGYRTVYTPFAQLYHHESASTGMRTNENEERLFVERWKEKYPVDPYYNRNFPFNRLNFRLK